MSSRNSPQDLGLGDRRDFLLPDDDGQRADRMPSGAELSDRFRDVIVADAGIVSEAEIAWNYGDAAASEAAARDARDSGRDDPGTQD